MAKKEPAKVDGRRNNKGTIGNRGGTPATKYKPEYCELLIGHMKEGLTIDSFGALCDVSPGTVHAWVAAHPEFKEARQKGDAYQRLFYEKLTRAMAAGAVEGSASALVWLTRNCIGWRNNEHVRISGDPDGAPIATRAMTKQEVDARYAELLAKAVAQTEGQ